MKAPPLTAGELKALLENVPNDTTVATVDFTNAGNEVFTVVYDRERQRLMVSPFEHSPPPGVVLRQTPRSRR